MSQEPMGKKDREDRKRKAKMEKAERKKEREANRSKGADLDSMMAWIDEDGNITNTPPDPNKKKKEIDLEEIQLGAAKRDPVQTGTTEKTGTVTFFNEAKGYGFIVDSQSKQSIFVHANDLLEPIKDGNRVSFETEQAAKGPKAVKVKKI
jgi:cold shock CspA family protein